MRRLLLLALLVSLAAGCGSSGHSPGTRTVVYPTAPANDVPRWVSVERLPNKAIPGAVLFAQAG
jgi:hypothetical protein